MKDKLDLVKVKNIIHTVGLNNNLTDSEVTKIIESQFRLAYDVIKDLNLKDILPEEVENIKTNFYFKYIGKLYVNKESLEQLKRKDDFYNKLINNKHE